MTLNPPANPGFGFHQGLALARLSGFRLCFGLSQVGLPEYVEVGVRRICIGRLRLIGANCWLPLGRKQLRPPDNPIVLPSCAKSFCCYCIALRNKLKLSRKQSLWPKGKPSQKKPKKLKSQSETQIQAISSCFWQMTAFRWTRAVPPNHPQTNVAPDPLPLPIPPRRFKQLRLSFSRSAELAKGAVRHGQK